MRGLCQPKVLMASEEAESPAIVIIVTILSSSKEVVQPEHTQTPAGITVASRWRCGRAGRVTQPRYTYINKAEAD